MIPLPQSSHLKSTCILLTSMTVDIRKLSHLYSFHSFQSLLPLIFSSYLFSLVCSYTLCLRRYVFSLYSILNEFTNFSSHPFIASPSPSFSSSLLYIDVHFFIYPSSERINNCYMSPGSRRSKIEEKEEMMQVNICRPKQLIFQ